MATLLNLVAPSAALGAAEHAVELFREQMLVRKVKNTLENRQADSPLAQARFAQAYGLVVTAGCIGKKPSGLSPPRMNVSLRR